VATDIAARGIDVDDVSHVFNYDLPDVPETFVHRIGRTARAGKDGIAISFCSPDEEQDLRAIEKLTRVKIPEGDKAIYEKLPPPQKETAESEMRNARGRMNRGEAQARADKSREKPARGKKQRADDARSLKQENARGSKFEQKRIDPRLCEGDDGNKREGGEGKKPGSNGQDGDARRRHRRNRPGSRARRRMRENGGAV
jgi:ATP-dependent RNA helicase RhlE